MTLSVDTTVTILSSRTRVYKTDAFLLATRHFRAGDAFFAAIAEAVMLHWADGFENGAFAAETADRAHTFFFVTGTAAGLNARDIVFYAYSGADAVRRGDGRLYALLRTEHFRLELKPAALPPKPGDFSKLYRLSHADYVNFPLLSAEQLAIVEKQDEHVLVQGVAGSGKTNVCIDKIVYAACEGYAGRVLYSTFSRGLLLDTRGKVAHLCESLAAFGVRHREGRLLFLDGDHKRAAENHLGLRFAAEDVTDIAKKVADVLFFLQNKVDYRLPEDFLPAGENGGVADEGYFVRAYVRGIKNHRLAGRLARIKHLSYEVVYKEIFGVIMGCCDPENPRVPLSPEAYYDRRKDSFTQPECEVIYSLARDYAAHLDEVGLTDNNRIARKLLENTPKIEYSLAVLDEVQDLTEVCLVYYRAIARKLFCVGDALQMINPAYFSFAYLKRLLYEKDIISVAALTHNYRNSRAIAALVEALSALNLKTFGTHSFVLGGVSVDTDVPTAVGRADGGLLAALADAPFGGYTVIAPSREAKERLQARLPQAEVLTVSEAKGLEREVVVLVDLLSHAADKWDALSRTLVNRKQADENSAYRYYFNLFYVGLSRAKTHLYVTESALPALFAPFFETELPETETPRALKTLEAAAGRAEPKEDELVDRVTQFLQLGQFDNARTAAGRIAQEGSRKAQLQRAEVYESLVFHRRHREAGVRLWEIGLLTDARNQFLVAGDTDLLKLFDASQSGDHALDVSVADYFTAVEGNDLARKLILDTVNKDLKAMQEKAKMISTKGRTLWITKT